MFNITLISYLIFNVRVNVRVQIQVHGKQLVKRINHRQFAVTDEVEKTAFLTLVVCRNYSTPAVTS